MRLHGVQTAQLDMCASARGCDVINVVPATANQMRDVAHDHRLRLPIREDARDLPTCVSACSTRDQPLA